MRFGNASWGFRETALEDQLRITHEMGLSLLELGIANAPNDLPLDITDAQIEEVKNLFKKYNVELLCAATGNDFTNGNTDDLPKLKHVVDICEKLGIKILRIFAGFSPVEEVVGEKWDCMIRCLTEIASYSNNVVLAIETHGGVNGFDDGVQHFYSTSSKPDVLQRMLLELPESIKVNFDPANLWAVGIRCPEEVYAVIKDRVAAVHLKDFVTLPSGHMKPAACGDSEMDWDAIMCSLNPELPMLFEYENVEDVKDGLLRCYQFINEKINTNLEDAK